MAKLREIYEVWEKVNYDLFKESKDYIKECLSKTIDNSVSLDECDICVTYDGGNHPEYDATTYSHVERVYCENGNVYLDTKDCTHYDIENITAIETYDIAYGVGYIIDNEFEL